MEISVKPDGEDCYLVTCPDQMEWRARIDLISAVKEATADEPLRGLILDLGKVDYINSAGLGAIFILRKYARELGAEIVMVRPNRRVKRLLETINLPKLIFVAGDLDEARARLQTAAPAGSA